VDGGAVAEVDADVNNEHVSLGVSPSGRLTGNGEGLEETSELGETELADIEGYLKISFGKCSASTCDCSESRATPSGASAPRVDSADTAAAATCACMCGAWTLRALRLRASRTGRAEVETVMWLGAGASEEGFTATDALGCSVSGSFVSGAVASSW